MRVEEEAIGAVGGEGGAVVLAGPGLGGAEEESRWFHRLGSGLRIAAVPPPR